MYLWLNKCALSRPLYVFLVAPKRVLVEVMNGHMAGAPSAETHLSADSSAVDSCRGSCEKRGVWADIREAPAGSKRKLRPTLCFALLSASSVQALFRFLFLR